MKKIIGQEVLCADIKHMLPLFPLFTILIGPKGSGKKTVASWVGEQLVENWIATEHEGSAVVIGTTVADIRGMIDISHRMSGPILYIIQDADSMSAEAKGALLKITEEPPKQARFIMTLQNANSMPDTIISRAIVLHMNPYSKKDIEEYVDGKYSGLVDVRYLDFDTPGDVDLFMQDTSIYDYAETVVENIAEVTTANALKIGDKLSLKANEEKYDLALFWKIFIKICLDMTEQDSDLDSMLYYANGAYITSKYLNQLSIRGVNKQMLFTNWVLVIRKEWS